MKKLYSILFALLITINLFATNYFVKQDAAGTSDGLSWTDAYIDLQTALSIAISGDSVFVAAGTYIPHASDRYASFVLKDGVKIFGGFAGNEIITSYVLDNRDFEVNETILSGDLSADDIEFTNNSENSYHVVNCDASVYGNITSSTELDGFTIKGGNANLSTSNNDYGGGIYIYAFINDIASPTLKNLTFKYNSATYGGAISNYAATSSATCDFSISDSYFYKNRAYQGSTGGAIYNVSAGNLAPTITNVVFSNNSAYNATGVISSYGGAVYNWALTNGVCNPIFTNVLFYKNTVGFLGSAVFNRASSNTVSTCKPKFINVTFTENKSTGGPEASMYNDTDGAACTPELINVLMWDEQQYSMGTPEIENYGVASANISNSLILNSGGSSSWNTALGIDGGNNIDSEPYFIDQANGDVTLKSVSPALNAGNTTYGNNIGYYQGSGVDMFVIFETEDFVICEGEVLPTINFDFFDLNPAQVSFTTSSSNVNFILNEDISISGTGTNRILTISNFVNSTGTSLITVFGENNIGEKDSIEFNIKINQIPIISNVSSTYNTGTSTYTLEISPWNINYNVWIDGNLNADGGTINLVSSGSHTISVDENGCASDDYVVNLPVYVNNIPLEVSYTDETYIKVCKGDNFPVFTFIVRDDSLQYVNYELTAYNISDSAFSILEINDSTFSVSLDSNYIINSYPGATIDVTNIYGESQNISLTYEFKEKPTITSINRDYNNTTYCITPVVETSDYSLTKYSIDGEATWKNIYESICELTYGNYTMVAELSGCLSDPYNFTLYEYTNNIPLWINSLTPQYQIVCGTNVPGDIVFTVADDTLQNVTVEMSSNSTYLDAIINITQNNESTYTISFNDSIQTGQYYSIEVYAHNNLGEYAYETYTFQLSNAAKPVINNIIVDTIADQWGGPDNYCFRLDVSNINDLYNSQVYIQGTGWNVQRTFEDQICSFSLDNYSIMISENACYSEPYLVNILGVSDLKLVDNFFNIYPNPNNGLFNIEFENQLNEKYNLEITDITGKVLISKENIQGDIQSIDMTNTPKGIYFVVVRSEKYMGVKRISLQ